MKHSESITTLAAALVEFHREVKSIAKDSVNPAYKSRFASLETITENVRPLLAKHGLAVVQGGGVPTSDETGSVTAITVETMLLHSSGEWISNGVTLPLDKATPQGVGSAVTYGRRYGLSALLALTTDEDDDAEAAEPRTTQRMAAPSPHLGKATMKIGKSKGKPLSEIPDKDLEGAIKWARTTDAAKFDSAIAEMQSELARREITPAKLQASLDADAADLPF